MASIIRIKRSSTVGNPTTLAAGELAYSALANTGFTGGTATGGNILYIGMGTETAGNAANHYAIGGYYYTQAIDNATNSSTASTLVKRDASGNFSAGTITATLSGNASTATALATGRTIALTGDVSYTSGSFDGTGNVTGTATLANTAVTAGSYGSSTAIPTFTVDSKGRLTAAGTAAISTTLSLNAGGSTSASVALGTDNLTFTSTSGITTSISKVSTTATLTIGIDSTVATLTGSQTLTNKTLTAPLISSITGVSGNLVISAAAGNNSISLTPTGTGTVDVNSKRITSVADPTQAQDAATKAYVDSMSNGLDVKQSVVAASTAALTVTYNNGTSGVGATLTNAGTQAAFTLDGIALSAGDRVLIKDQAAGLQNGVYTVTTVGTISTNWVLTRATDFDNSPGTEVGPGVFFFVEQGNTQADNGYVISTDTAITIGTTAIVFSQFSGAGQITAGAGLTKSGNTIDVVGTLNRITVNADSIDISASYVGQTSITTLGTIGTGTWQGSVIGPTYGGTGVNNGSNTLTLAGNVSHAGAFTQTFTATGNTSVTLPTTGTLATLAGSETLTNKTLTSPVISTIVNTGTLTLPTSTDTLVGRATTDTLTNKTLTSPTINGGAITALTGLAVRDTSAAFDVTIAATSSTALTAGRTLTIDMVNAARTIKLAGNIDLAANFTTSGANALTLTTTGATNVTLPTTGTLVNSAVTTLSSLSSVGTISTGTWNGSVIGAAYGGTGVANNSANTITFTGAFSLGLTLTANTSVTLPTSGTLVNTAVTTLSSLASIGTITTGTWNGSVIGAVYGGTGLSSYTTGDTIYASASNTLSKLAIGTSGQVMQVSAGGIPSWGDVDGGTY